MKHATLALAFLLGCHRFPEWRTTTALAVVGGATVAGEAYCFADCATAGKLALVGLDAAALLAELAVFTAIERAMNH